MVRNVFAGGNTPLGFYSYYDYITNNEKEGRLIILKGGPGVGKSTLIKKIAKLWREKYESIELFRCSGDEESYDGVYLPENNIAVIDGTAPHTVDPKLPGLFDEIVNLGDFIDCENIKNHSKEIREIFAEKSACYKRAYLLLGNAKNYVDFEKEISKKLINEKDIFSIAKSILKDVKSIGKAYKGGRERKVFYKAITPVGVLDYKTETFNSTFFIQLDFKLKGMKSLVLNRLAKLLIMEGYEIESAFSPFSPLDRDSIYLPNLNVGIGNMDKCYNIYSKYELECGKAKKEEKNLELIERNNLSINALVDETKKELEKAKNLHKQVENYYIDSMNFDGINEVSKKLIERIV